MNVDTVSFIVDQAVRVIIITSLPAVGVGLFVGLIIAIIQAVTQVQEQTLTFVPKMIVVLIVISMTFPWMSRIVIEMTLDLWKNIPQYSR